MSYGPCRSRRHKRKHTESLRQTMHRRSGAPNYNVTRENERRNHTTRPRAQVLRRGSMCFSSKDFCNRVPAPSRLQVSAIAPTPGGEGDLLRFPRISARRATKNLFLAGSSGIDLLPIPTKDGQASSPPRMFLHQSRAIYEYSPTRAHNWTIRVASRGGWLKHEKCKSFQRLKLLPSSTLKMQIFFAASCLISSSLVHPQLSPPSSPIYYPTFFSL